MLKFWKGLLWLWVLLLVGWIYLLIFLICDQRSFLLLITSLNLFFNDLKFLLFKSSICLVKDAQDYLYYFKLLWKLCFQFLSQNVLFVFKKDINISELISYPITFLKVFISSSFVIEFIRSLLNCNLSSTNIYT